MFIQIEDPSDLPRPPEEVQIRSVDIDPYPDGQRLHVLIELTPFTEPPDLSLRVMDLDGVELADLSIIGAHQNKLGLTVHLRGSNYKSPLSLEAVVQYEALGTVHKIERKIKTAGEHGNDTA